MIPTNTQAALWKGRAERKQKLEDRRESCEVLSSGRGHGSGTSKRQLSRRVHGLSTVQGAALMGLKGLREEHRSGRGMLECWAETEGSWEWIWSRYIAYVHEINKEYF